MKTMIKNQSLLAEEHRSTDLFDYKSPAKHLGLRFAKMPKSSVVALIGPHGIGKSVMLEEVKKQISDEATDWFQFDAWKYPDRQDLWEGFILDFARHIDKKLFDEMVQKLDGEYGKKKIGLMKSTSLFAKTAGNMFLPGVGSVAGDALDKLSYLFSTSPIHRLYGYEQLLKYLVEKSRDSLFIVLEDVDRSKDAGFLFLETVSFFFRNNNFDKNIRIIVPISNKCLIDEGTKASVIKAADYIEEFNAKDLDVGKFLKSVLVKEITSDDVNMSRMKSLFEDALNSGHISIRHLKLIFRAADSRYKNLLEKGFKANPLICLTVETMKYLPGIATPEAGSMYDQALAQGGVREGMPNLVLFSIAINKSIQGTLDYMNSDRPRPQRLIVFSSDRDFKKEAADTWLLAPDAPDKKNEPRIPSIYFSEY